ncbi:bifunctional transcriptional activator/DNA repair enzyme AdaA [Alicyclobacillus dauci]|uniref:Bifunctional transcriptional activator/DNA repair enzyme AdaA n=1 Tax=Alicyclobacillus dauci TaxID=1475485 RepID=A0ABY6Z5H8_9BACL|nr:bifunctional transcriptional activator/DNA repair enzyme AdaA [Alicyclobacillus dauci]WAH37903.1 bifunctional transcriptional activator/DNA repair enzyme AdaA [Alicyclobacillus dauci]
MDEVLWEAIVHCKPTFDGQYFYGVITTHIFCRPSCRSRTPLPENTRIFRGVNEAKAAGFRPCKRCRPDEYGLGPDEELVQSAKDIMEQRYQDPLTLDKIAGELAISPYHLHRVFKRLTGTTPADYLFNKRLRAAKQALRTELYRTVTDIAIGVGFRSPSHFSTMFQRKTGYSPSDYRKLNLGSPIAEEVER